MESAGLRQRDSEAWAHAGTPVGKATRRVDAGASNIPRYVIDLSLPPAKRYQHVAKAFKSQLASLPVLFDEVVQNLYPKISVGAVRSTAKLLLRRVHDEEQNEELKGIHTVTGIEMYLLVAFNVLLDLFMGCTSGGFRINPHDEDSKMLHYRTLDWGMDALRQVVVHLDFVHSSGGPICASSVTYVGYVGVLTGVKNGLSMSLNFRPNHDSSTRLANVQFYFHHLMVLFGFRPSISSVLRKCLLPSGDCSKRQETLGQTLASLQTSLPAVPTTAAYLIFSDGDWTITMEKDHRSALVRSGEDFIVIGNHDEVEELEPEKMKRDHDRSRKVSDATGMTDLLAEESILRKGCAVRQWEKSRTRSSRIGSRSATDGLKNVIKLLETYPIVNEETHYAVVMDPKAGEFVWAQRYLEPSV